jgi:hypothetical protein
LEPGIVVNNKTVWIFENAGKVRVCKFHFVYARTEPDGFGKDVYLHAACLEAVSVEADPVISTFHENHEQHEKHNKSSKYPLTKVNGERNGGEDDKNEK